MGRPPKLTKHQNQDAIRAVADRLRTFELTNRVPDTVRLSWVATKKCYNHRRGQFQLAGNRGGVFPYLSPMALGKNDLATANGSPHNPSGKGDA